MQALNGFREVDPVEAFHVVQCVHLEKYHTYVCKPTIGRKKRPLIAFPRASQ